MRHISYIDPHGELPIIKNLSAVGIFRKPQGKNTEHAFILVEYYNDAGQICFERYDLVTDGDHPGKAKVLMSKKPIVVENKRDAGRVLMGILNCEAICGLCYSVPTQLRKKLRRLVEDSETNPGNYGLPGDIFSIGQTAAATHAISPEAMEATRDATAATAETASGPAAAKHARAVFTPAANNCFTWARGIFHQLEVPLIKKTLPIRINEFFEGSRTSRYLKAKAESAGGGGGGGGKAHKHSKNKQRMKATGQGADSDEDDEPRSGCLVM